MAREGRLQAIRSCASKITSPRMTPLDVPPHFEIARPAFEVTLDVFLHAGLITRRHRYGDVVATPPS